MAFTLDNGIVSNAQGGQAVVVAVGVARVAYHKLNYARVGIWPFPDGQALNASYDGGQNIRIQNPATQVTCIFSYTQPAD
ncbi:hypothetical protein [Aquabacter cavernae]|uniref:hypothetical protein n=1 Tax=Aquabacter cavernae TaxID=2496029 RepID=UPI000F8EB4E1|nr:hypothetical protein [Aquabacter cavernae]